MSRFTTPLRIEDTGVAHNNREVFRVLESFTYEVGGLGSGLLIHVPVGFETDFASVPRFLWNLVPPWGPHGKAAVLHDFLYRKESGFSKIVGDAIFCEALEVMGASWWLRTAMYVVVRLFGHSSYHWKSRSTPGTALTMLDDFRELKDEFKTKEKRSFK